MDDWTGFSRPRTALLVIEDGDDQAVVDEQARRAGWHVRIEHDLSTALMLLTNAGADLVATDDFEFLELLNQSFFKESPEGPFEIDLFVLFVAVGEEDFAGAYSEGASMVVASPVTPDGLFLPAP